MLYLKLCYFCYTKLMQSVSLCSQHTTAVCWLQQQHTKLACGLQQFLKIWNRFYIKTTDSYQYTWIEHQKNVKSMCIVQSWGNLSNCPTKKCPTQSNVTNRRTSYSANFGNKQLRCIESSTMVDDSHWSNNVWNFNQILFYSPANVG